MDKALVYLIVIIVALVIIIPIYFWQRKKQRKRAAALQKLAILRGFEFTERPEPEKAAPLIEGFELFKMGTRRGAPTNLLEGGTSIFPGSLFDFTYYTTEAHGVQHGSNLVAHNNTVAILNLKEARLPRFSIRRERWGDKVKDKLWKHDIDLPDAPEFSRDYWLTGDDFEAVTAVLHGQVLAMFMDEGLQKDEVIEVQDDRLMFYRASIVKPEALDEFIDRAGELARIFDIPPG